MVTYTDAAGNDLTPALSESSYTIDKRSAGKWTVSAVGTSIAAATYKIAMTAPSIFGATPSSAEVRVITADALIGTHQAGLATPHAQRAGLTLAQLTAQDFYMGISNADVPFYSVQTGNWTDGSTWNKGVAPTATDNVTISASTVVTVNATSVAAGVTVNSGGTLQADSSTLTVTNAIANNGTVNAAGSTIAAATLTNNNGAVVNISGGTTTLSSVITNNSGATVNVTNGTLTVNGASGTGITNTGTFTQSNGTVNIGDGANANRRLTNTGTLTVSGGTLNLFGNLVHSGTAFNQSGGNINIDPNAGGVTGSSTTAANYTLYLTTAVNWTGGTLTVVDPPASTSATHYTLYYSVSATSEVSTAHTLRFGNNVSSDAGGNAIGYLLYNYISTGKINFGTVEVNGPVTGTATATNRIVKQTSWSEGIKGDLVIQNKGELQLNSIALTVGGNISVAANSKLIADSTLTLAAPSGTSSVVNTAAQSITNNGTIENIAGAGTASFSSLTINNNNATGVTFNSPLSVSGTLTLTAGKVNTTTAHLLTLGTTTLAGTLSGGSSTAYIDGPFARTFAASRTASGTYGTTTLLPIGKGATYLPAYIDPTTAASGAVTFTGEAFTSNAGTQGVGVTSLSPNRWEILPVSSANLTNAFVRLGDASILAASKIIQAPSAAGQYNGLSSAVTYTSGTPNVLTTTSALPVAEYTGYFAYGELTSCIAPSAQSASLSASNKTTTSFTVNFAAEASASHYLVVRYTGTFTPVAPSDYTTYSGTALGGTVVYSGPLLTFNQTGLTAGTSYTYYVYTYNNSGCYGPVYNTVSPLIQAVSTCASATGAPGTPTGTPSESSISANWTASATGGVDYILEVATNTGFTTYVSGYNNLNVGTVLTYNITGLAANTTYYVRVRAKLGDCVSTNTTYATIKTLCNAVTSYPWTENFDGMSSIGAAVLPSCWSNTTEGTTYFASQNAALQTYNDPRSAPYYLTVYYPTTASVLWTPPMQLTAGKSYDFSFWFVGDDKTGWICDVLRNTSASTSGAVPMGSSFVVATDQTLNGTNYTKVTRTFVPSASGVYYFGIQAYSSTSAPFYMGFDDFTVEESPASITSFNPLTVCSAGGQTVTITGSHFTDVTAVKFNGVNAASFNVVNETTITAVTPAGVTAGTISVTAHSTTATSADALAVTATPVVGDITGGNVTLCSGATAELASSASVGTGVWTSSDEAVAHVDINTGAVTAVGEGTATITYTVTNNGCTAFKTTSINVNDAVNITSFTNAQTVTPGDDAQFTVVATGTGLNYQWHVSTNGGMSFSPLSNGGAYAGVTTATLSVNDVDEIFNGYLYHVVITGTAPCAPVTSDNATLGVSDIGITAQPESVTLCNSGNADFSVTADGTGLTYQWYENKGSGPVAISNGTVGGITYSGATSATLHLVNAGTAANGWSYHVVVSMGSAQAVSGSATLTVNSTPQVNANPANAEVCYTGGTVNYTVGATGTGLSYQWQYATSASGPWNNVADATPANTTYSGAATATLAVTTTAATPVSTYYYRAVVTGTAPCTTAASDAATLTFFTPAITGQPAAAGVTVGQSTTFTVTTSAPSPSYQWQYATSASGPWSNVTAATPAGTTYSGDTSATLTVNANTTAEGSGYYYRAVVTSGGCSVNSNSAQMTVTGYCIPTFTNAAVSDYVSAMTIATTTFSATPAQVTSAPYYSYLTGGTNTTTLYSGNTYTANVTVGTSGSTHGVGIWIDLNSDGDFTDTGEFVGSGSITSGSSGTISMVIPSGVTLGNKRMRIRSLRGNTVGSGVSCSTIARGNTVDFMITIGTAPDCTGTPATVAVSANTSTFCLSGSATLTATNIPAFVSGISLQWYNGAGAIDGATSATYTTPTLTASETYYLRVTCVASGLHSDSNSVAIIVNTPSVATTAPGERCGTGTVTLGATGSAGTTLAWYAASTGGTALATGTSYVTPSISTTTPYYVEAIQTGTSASSGPANYLAITGTKTAAVPTTSNYMTFTATATATITSVTVYASVAGQLNLQLANSSGVVLQTYNYTITAGQANSTTSALGTAIVIPVNFSVPVGTGLRLGIASGTTATIIRNDTGSASYYSVANNGVSFTSNSSFSTAYWYYFYNVGVASTCISPRSMVNATVNSGPALTLSSSAVTICGGTPSSAVTLTAGSSDYDDYQWSPSTGVSGNAASGWTFNPSATTSYTLTASQSGGSQCNRTAALTVTVNNAPAALMVTPETASLCNGEAAVQLTASGGLVTGSYTVGTQTSTSTTTGVTPFSSNYEGARVQYLVRASELSAMGITAGDIRSLAFTVTSQGTGTYPQLNYSIKIGKTNATTIGPGYATLVGSFTTVFTSASVAAPAVGERLFTFSTPYAWDGTSNIVIDICHDGDTTGTCASCYSSNSGVAVMTTTGQNSVYSTYADNAASCGSTSGGSFTTYTTRPIMKFSVDQAGSVTWAPTTGLYTDAGATTPYSGGNAVSVYAKPVTTTTYTVTTTAGSGCTATDTAVITVSDKTWTGAVSTNWNVAGNWCGNAVPTSADNVVIPNVANKPIISGNIVAAAGTLKIETGGKLTVKAGNSLTVTGVIDIAAANALVVESYGALKQVNDVANTGAGTAQVFRNSSVLYRNDFSMWSSPVQNQGLKAFSPNTLPTRFYSYNQTTDQFNVVPGLASADSNFQTAQGYLIRMPDAQMAGGVATGTFVPATLAPGGSDYNAGVQQMVFNGKYSGRPNNGTISYQAATSGNGYNAIGNPYPSPISIAAFFAANSGATDGIIYLWRKKNGAVRSAYCTVSADGEFVSNLDPAAENPNGLLQVGQGFIVKASNNIVFNNAMRQTVTAIDSSFFRMPTVERHRIRLNLYKVNTPVAQTLIAYKSNATMDVDNGVDALYLNDAAVGLNSMINGTPYAIQGRALPFSNQDVVPMQFKADVAETFTISLAEFDGLFAGSQNIYLKDNLLNVVHNIKAGSYTFASAAGTFNNRFEVVYTDAALGTDNPVLDPNSIIIYKNDSKLHINSGTAVMKDIRIFDIRGRLVYEKTAVNATTAEVSGLAIQEEMLIVQVTTVDNAKVSKKIIY
ncbi:MAG: GEVED domain-containing protein [Flavobacterium sp.]